MAELKTKVSNSSVSEFIDSVEDQKKKDDCFALLKLFQKITGENAKMWGSSIIGFGSYHYKSERSTQEGYWPITGFSPRKQNLTIYIMPGFKNFKNELEKLGKFKTSVSCLYIKKLEDIDLKILEKIIKGSVIEMKKKYKVNS